ncbi:bifunctional ornithine acetyltransferase/N-acetylglutamate synthase [bacterium]|nr:bifunctional ornithine acetyltransferase/N-acetylglutamate synthase [bacterium]|tara:strand:+ start:1510 stop:2688 length:1179 start_codon:yes stop_codon:yes gene_type:complete
MIEGVYLDGIASGIKSNGKKDLGYIFVPDACASACVLTQNACRAAPVLITEKHKKLGRFKAVFFNSGNANMLTGSTGFETAQKMQQVAAESLGLSLEAVAIASTGKIGELLDLDTVNAGAFRLFQSLETQDFEACMTAMLTTDLLNKSTYQSATINGQKIEVAGMAKGSGMIEPNMATMLAFLVTNVAIEPEMLQQIFSQAVSDTFNMISVDSDTSTNDTALIISRPARTINWDDADQFKRYYNVVYQACRDLAIQIVRDGEGMTKLMHVTVRQAPNAALGQQIVKSIINSPLVKTALHGGDPNWGRIIAAAGKAPGASAGVRVDCIELRIANTLVFQSGEPIAINTPVLRKELQESDTVAIDLALGCGTVDVEGWGTDLSKTYIDINVAYT